LFIPSTKEFILIGVATSAGKEKKISASSATTTTTADDNTS
jgi:hypothetical protein